MAKWIFLVLLVATVSVFGSQDIDKEIEERARAKAEAQAVAQFQNLDLSMLLGDCQSSILCLPFRVAGGLLDGALITAQGLTNKIPLLCGTAVADGFLHPDMLNPITITLNCKAGLLSQGCGIRLFAGSVLGLVIGVTDLLDSTIRVATGLVSAVTGLLLPVDLDVQIKATISVVGTNWNVDLEVCHGNGQCETELGIHVAIDGLLDLAQPVWKILLTACRGGVITHVKIDVGAGVTLTNRPAIANK